MVWTIPVTKKLRTFNVRYFSSLDIVLDCECPLAARDRIHGRCVRSEDSGRHGLRANVTEMSRSLSDTALEAQTPYFRRRLVRRTWQRTRIASTEPMWIQRITRDWSDKDRNGILLPAPHFLLVRTTSCFLGCKTGMATLILIIRSYEQG